MNHARQWVLLLVVAAALAVPASSSAQAPANRVALAYVWQDVVTLANTDGTVLTQPGPSFAYGVGARLLWSADADMLYIARNDALFATGAAGGAAAQIATGYGRTLAISQDQSALYYLNTTETARILDEDEPGSEHAAFELRTVPLDALGGAGRLAGYFGRFDPASASADIAFAAALYARDSGLLDAGRPHLWPTYGANVFGTCCFPAPGLGMLNGNNAEFMIYDLEFIPGAAAVSLTHTHLAGPTTVGTLRVIDLITGGTRDYVPVIGGTPLVDGVGAVERMAWSPDDTTLYFTVREPPSNPLTLTTETSFPADLRSADIVVYRLNLVTSALDELAYRRDVYGVSSLAATDRYVFAAVVDANVALVEALNARRVRPGSSPTDPELTDLWPATHLWRIDLVGGEDEDILDDVWGVTARPIR